MKTIFLLGYVRITDMGIARQWKLENSSDTSGTPGYMGKKLIILMIFLIFGKYKHLK